MTTISQTNDAHLIVPLNTELLARLSAKAHEAGKDIASHAHDLLHKSVESHTAPPAEEKETPEARITNLIRADLKKAPPEEEAQK